MFYDMMRDIVCAYGPSGREEKVSSVIKSYIEDFADETYSDALGNLIAVKRGTSGKKIMLSAHMDQIGFVVLDIDEKGFLRVSQVGGINVPVSVARGVVFENGTPGVIYREVDGVDSAKLSIANLFIDIGASSRQEAEKLVSIGDMAVYEAHWLDLCGGKYACAAMDNRICCAIEAQAFLTADSPHDVYAVFTVQEEVGCRGSQVAAYAIEPDFGLNFDVTAHGDTPKAAPLSLTLGKGAAIKVMDRSVIVPMKARDYLEACAIEAGAPYQLEVLPYGGTDTSSVQRSRAGVIACCLSVPCRYVHTPCETVDMRDVQACIDVAVRALGKIELPL